MEHQEHARHDHNQPHVPGAKQQHPLHGSYIGHAIPGTRQLQPCSILLGGILHLRLRTHFYVAGSRWLWHQQSTIKCQPPPPPPLMGFPLLLLVRRCLLRTHYGNTHHYLGLCDSIYVVVYMFFQLGLHKQQGTYTTVCSTQPALTAFGKYHVQLFTNHATALSADVQYPQ
jgi:hypothetical protein